MRGILNREIGKYQGELGDSGDPWDDALIADTNGLRHAVHELCFIAAPIRLRGATGSPVRPIPMPLVHATEARAKRSIPLHGAPAARC